MSRFILSFALLKNNETIQKFKYTQIMRNIGRKKSFIFISMIVYSLVAFANFKTIMAAESDVLLWTFQTGGKIYASPIIRNDTLYIGSLDSTFYAIDVTSGDELWHYKTQNQIFTTAAIYENLISFESGNILYCLNIDGALEWKDTLYSGPVVNQHDEWDYFHSSPSLVDSIVYIGSENGLVFGVNIKTGVEVFQCQAPTANKTVETKPVVYNNKIYFGDWDGVLYAFDLTTSDEVWEYDTKDDFVHGWVNAIQNDPVIYNDHIYFGGRSCCIYSLGTETGVKDKMFHDSRDMWLVGGPTISDTILYMGSSDQHIFQSFGATGLVGIWNTNVYQRIFGKSLVDGDYVYFGTGLEVSNPVGSLMVLNKTTGVVKQSFNVGGQVHSSVLLQDSVIYFGCADGNIYAVDQGELLTIPRPNIFLKGSQIIELGELQKSELFDTAIYVYNNGTAKDSVTAQASGSKTTADPSYVIIQPGDSMPVTFTINIPSMIPSNYTITLYFTSQKSALPIVLSKTITLTVVEGPSGLTDPEARQNTMLEQNYPNPFGSYTTITYSILEECPVNLKIYNSIGEEISQLVNEFQPSGVHKVVFNSSELPCGYYFYELKTRNTSITKKMILIR
jgi:outer membrane protein assembly factor BamB